MATATRVVVVGGIAGGATAALRLRRLDEAADITLIERGPDGAHACAHTRDRPAG